MNESTTAKAPNGVLLYAVEQNPPDEKPVTPSQILPLVEMLVIGNIGLLICIYAVCQFKKFMWKNKSKDQK